MSSEHTTSQLEQLQSSLDDSREQHRRLAESHAHYVERHQAHMDTIDRLQSHNDRLKAALVNVEAVCEGHCKELEQAMVALKSAKWFETAYLSISLCGRHESTDRDAEEFTAECPYCQIVACKAELQAARATTLSQQTRIHNLEQRERKVELEVAGVREALNAASTMLSGLKHKESCLWFVDSRCNCGRNETIAALRSALEVRQ